MARTKAAMSPGCTWDPCLASGAHSCLNSSGVSTLWPILLHSFQTRAPNLGLMQHLLWKLIKSAAMDALLTRLGVQAMNYAIRSGLAVTSTYAISQCSRLLKSVDDRSLRVELESLQKLLEGKIRVSIASC